MPQEAVSFIGTLFFGFIFLGLSLRLLAGVLDRIRVRNYIENEGGHFLDARWTPFGKGWYGEKNDRIYKIRYYDAEGNERLAACKTSLLSGVYLSDDRIVTPSPKKVGTLSLEEENRRLRAELARLKNGHLS